MDTPEVTYAVIAERQRIAAQIERETLVRKILSGEPSRRPSRPQDRAPSFSRRGLLSRAPRTTQAS